MYESSLWFGQNSAEYWLTEFQESIDRCTGGRDTIEILLKTALNNKQSIDYHVMSLRQILTRIFVSRCCNITKISVSVIKEKGENAIFLHFPTVFSTRSKTEIIILATFNLLSANALNLDKSKFLSSGEELNDIKPALRKGEKC